MEEVLGDLDEAHRMRARRRGPLAAAFLVSVETLDMALALIRERLRRRGDPQVRRPAPSVSGWSRKRGRGPLVSWLDVKLGVRMLVKYPGLTLVGGLGIALGVAVGAVAFVVWDYAVDPRVPLEEGDRLVGIRSWDARTSEPEWRTLSDFLTWRRELTALDEVAAFRPTSANLLGPGGTAEPVPVAEMTASGFRVAGVDPVLGRPLVEADEREGAPRVAVLGHGVWERHFGGDREVVGRTVRLGDTPHTVVGVMPEGFRFPVAHRVWIPLRIDPAGVEGREGPEIYVVGRLARGATREGAQAELTTLARREAAASPGTHARLEPRLVSYPVLMGGAVEEGDWRFYLLQLLLVLLLVVVAVNVAVLVYARTATRQGELAVRTALGASRRRIVGQLFAEALVLAAVAAGVGLLAARAALRQMYFVLNSGANIPFWMDFDLSLRAVAHVLGVTLLVAVIVGVVPALGVTRRRGGTTLGRIAGATGTRLGASWTAMIVVQVAVAAAVLPAAGWHTAKGIQRGFADPGFAADAFLTARIEASRETAETGEGGGDLRGAESRLGELIRRLRAEPPISGATVVSHLPGEERRSLVEVDGVPAAGESPGGHRVRTARVEAGFFGVFGVPVLAGRVFHAGDLEPGAATVVVNEAFVREVLGGRSAPGRRLRVVADGWGAPREDASTDPAPWAEIVGVVGNLPPEPLGPDRVQAKVYRPEDPASAGAHVPSGWLVLGVAGAPATSVVGRLREVATAVDPSLQLHQVLPLDEVYRRGERGLERMGALAVGLGAFSVILLSAAGIWAMMSFAVTTRRREIGIRSALGADPRRLLASVFTRALGQLAAGGLAGLGGVAVLDRLAGGELMGGHGEVALPTAVAALAVVGLASTLGPARRGLSIEPVEALRGE